MRKRLYWALFPLLMIVHISWAQDAATNGAPPDVVILKLSWSKQASPDSVSHTPIRDVKDYDPRDLARLPDPRPPAPINENQLELHSYSMRIKNVGEKTMTGVIWEYVFTDPKSNKEIGRRRFYSPHFDESPLKIYKNQSATLDAKSSLPPTNVVSVQDAGKEKSQYLERAEIKCLRYADGSWWKPATARASECEELEIEAERRKEKIKLQ